MQLLLYCVNIFSLQPVNPQFTQTSMQFFHTILWSSFIKLLSSKGSLTGSHNVADVRFSHASTETHTAKINFIRCLNPFK